MLILTRGTKKLFFLWVAVLFLTAGSVNAANKVVVIPLGGKKPAQSVTNSIGMQFNYIPSGDFMMGCMASNYSYCATLFENPHKVFLKKPFYMQTTEVTNKQWNDVIVFGAIGGKNPSVNKDNKHPVENVNWYEAATLAVLLSQAENRSICYDLRDCNLNVSLPVEGMTCASVGFNENCTGYRLPTEAEWEYAARAGTATPFANPVYYDSSIIEQGAGLNYNLEAMGWYIYHHNMTGAANTAFPPSGNTHIVGTKQDNRWGLYDMHGNVLEWCRDWWDASTPYTGNAPQDPTGPIAGTKRVVRGGSYIQDAVRASSSARMSFEPKHSEGAIGFRLVLPYGVQ